MTLFAFTERCPSQCHSLINGAVISDFRRFADHDSTTMIDENPPANDRSGMDLDTGCNSRQMRKEPCEPFQAVIPAPVRSPVNENGLKSGITGQNLPRIAGGWITFNNTFDIFAKTTEHVSRQELTIREQDNNRFGKNVHVSYPP